MYFQQTVNAYWRIMKADAKGAFFQGKELKREVSIMPTPELVEAYNLEPHELLLLRKAVYRLIDAPKEWFDCVHEAFLEMGWLAVGLDPCVWRLLDADGTLVAVAMIHVDDLLISGKEDHESYVEFIAWMKERFVWEPGRAQHLYNVDSSMCSELTLPLKSPALQQRD